MASFFTELVSSIFTPGPNRTLVAATNATFACLQALLGILLLATRSIHFVVLSLLCAGLWWAINWFAAELEANRSTAEAPPNPSDPQRGEPDSEEQSGDDTETERERHPKSQTRPRDAPPVLLAPDQAEALRRRTRSVGEGGEVSTEDEWEKVSEEGGKER
jgi:cytoskeletal protein RodZ